MGRTILDNAARRRKAEDRRIQNLAALLPEIEREQYLWRAGNARSNGHILCGCGREWHHPLYSACTNCHGDYLGKPGTTQHDPIHPRKAVARG